MDASRRRRTGHAVAEALDGIIVPGRLPVADSATHRLTAGWATDTARR
jgi:hypothetical protein